MERSPLLFVKELVGVLSIPRFVRARFGSAANTLEGRTKTALLDNGASRAAALTRGNVDYLTNLLYLGNAPTYSMKDEKRTGQTSDRTNYRASSLHSSSKSSTPYSNEPGYASLSNNTSLTATSSPILRHGAFEGTASVGARPSSAKTSQQALDEVIPCDAAALTVLQLPSWSSRQEITMRLSHADAVQDGEDILKTILTRFWDSRVGATARWIIVRDEVSKDIHSTAVSQVNPGGASYTTRIQVKVKVPGTDALIPRVIGCFPMRNLRTLSMYVPDCLGNVWDADSIFATFVEANGVADLALSGGSFCRLVSALLGAKCSSGTGINKTRTLHWKLFPRLVSLALQDVDLTRAFDGEAKEFMRRTTWILELIPNEIDSCSVLTLLLRVLSIRGTDGSKFRLSVRGCGTIISQEQWLELRTLETLPIFVEVDMRLDESIFDVMRE
ncbi:hypothetical protein PENSPDRAFT_730723 [Peniophora sp. CONT]|nr:hypothetical protein PENSPDRAFT_730723 [Peniophora sp. CONT]